MLRWILPLLIGFGADGLASAGEGKPVAAVAKAHLLGVGGSLVFPLAANLGIETELNFASKAAYYPFTSDSISALDVYSLFTSAKFYPVGFFFMQGGAGIQYLKQEPVGGSHVSFERTGVSMEAIRYGAFAALGLEFQVPNLGGFMGTEIVGVYKPFGATFQKFETYNQRMKPSEEEDYKNSIRHDPFSRWLIFFYGFYLR